MTRRDDGETTLGKSPDDKSADKDAASGAADAKPAKAGASAAYAPEAFDIRSEKLPKAIEEATLASGDFPYDKKLKTKRYEKELRALQIELAKLLASVKSRGERIVIVFEGRDAAGKGGAISRLTQHLNPRSVHVVALSKPTETEKGQWYFQRYIEHMPTRGEIAIFDRSWYNRAGVERVFNFCSEAETERFLAETPNVEMMLRRDGIILFKFFLSIGREMQMKRLHERWHDPLSRWKLSDIDFQAIEKWDAYTLAFDRMLSMTDNAQAPWTVIRANDKKRSRLEIMRHLVDALDYEGKDRHAIGKVDRKIAISTSDFLARGGES